MDTGTLIKKTKIPDGVGVPGRDETKKWIESQIPYQQLAGTNKLFDEQVVAYMDAVKTNFMNRMEGVYQRWRLNHWTANGNSVTAEYEDDVHVDETWKMLETIIPRIEEAIFEYDPAFEVEGVRDEMDQMKAIVVASYIRRRLELANARDYVHPTIRDALLQGIAALKLRWERVLRHVVERNLEHKFDDKGDPYYLDERRWVEKLVLNGPALTQVDMFRFLIDLDRGQLKDCRFMGDVSQQALHELKQGQELGLYVNVDQIERDFAAKTFGDPGAISDMNAYSRSIVSVWGQREIEQFKNGPKEAECFELWCQFDFGKDGFEGITDPVGKRLRGVHEVVFTKAAHVLIQARLNPHDKKFKPYGVARMSKNGHEMISVAPFDAVVRENAKYDRFESNVMRHEELAIAPLIQKPPGSDWPDTLLGVRPGTVLPGVGAVEVFKVPDLPQSVAFRRQNYREEHEELSGAPRTWQGTGSSPMTATEGERKMQEASRRLRGYIRGYADMWRQVGLMIYWMSQQFSTGAERFMVVGKASQVLGRYAEITPDMLQEDIDLRFIGLDSLHTYGSRGTGMVQWANQWLPIAVQDQEMRSMIDLPRIAQITFEHMVGRDRVREVFRLPTPEYMRMPQQSENSLLRKGLRVPIDDSDDHEEHLQRMISEGLLDMGLNPKTPKQVRNAILDHFQKHFSALEQQQQIEEAEQREAMMQAELEQTRTGGAQQGRETPAKGSGVASKQQGVAPGPTSGRTTPRSGREGSGISQQQMGQQGQ